MSDVSSDFDANVDGWTIVGDVASFAWQSTDGDPGGYISWVDQAMGATAYYEAPAAYLGENAAYYGGSLSYDIEDTGSDFSGVPDVELISSTTTLDYTVGQAGTSWTFYTVPLTETGWTVQGTGAAVSAGQMQQVLGDLTEVLIRAEYVTGDETGGLDNVAMVTPYGSVTLSGANTSAAAVFETDEAYPFAEALAAQLSSGLDNGSLTPVNYTSGSVAPGTPRGVVTITIVPTMVVAIPTTDIGLFITGGPTSITGGGQGETVIAGSSGLTYLDITPSGSAIDYIVAGDGANFITTSTTGGGNYQIDTGAGNDTIAVFGNGEINAGTGNNSISVSGGSSFLYSEGNDNITSNGAGTDTVDISTGRATINPGSANLNIYEESVALYPLFLAPGSGSDSVSTGAGGGTVYGGSGGNNILIAGAGVLFGGGAGDQLYATGSAPVSIYGGSGSETLSGAGGTLAGNPFPEDSADSTVAASTADNTFVPGRGNDTVIGGSGSDTVDFADRRAEYTLATGPDGTLLVTDNDSGDVDTLSGIGTLAFLDESQAPCYCRGTAIATEAGVTPVEALRIGDLVRTANGALRPVHWIGRRSYRRSVVAVQTDLLPVVFLAGALAPGVPARDLAVSPRHAMCLDAVLVPAALLVNGRSIRRATPQDVTYFHVELETHDILLAEGAPSESFVDCESRGMFQNACEFDALYPAGLGKPWEFCAPRVESGVVLETIRRRLAARAGLAGCHWDDAPQPGATVSYHVDKAGREEIAGWAIDNAQPQTRVLLDILVDGVAVARIAANEHRSDLAVAARGDGRCSFTYRFAAPLATEHRQRMIIRVVDGPVLASLLVQPEPDAPGKLEGYIDTCDGVALHGWARDPAWPDHPVLLDVQLDGTPIGQVRANDYRADLEAAGFGEGRHAFTFPISGHAVGGETITVRRAADAALLGEVTVPAREKRAA